MADHVDRQLANYSLLHQISQDSLTTSYLGEHLRLGTKAVIKVFHNKLVGDDKERFLEGARRFAHLEHPHILRLLDVGVEGGTAFLIMAYAPHGSLRQAFPKGTQLSPSRIVPYVKQVASALHYVHNQGLIHQNVKPENMLLGPDNEILLDDFYFPLLTQGSNFLSRPEMIGTVDYMAPEQLRGRPQPASDEYSLGIVVYEWLSGNPPFHGSFTEIANQHISTPPPPLHEKIPTISTEVERVVLTALEKDPRRRFATVQAFATAFEQASQPTPVISSAPPFAVAPQSQFAPLTALDTQLSHPDQPESVDTQVSQAIQPVSIDTQLSHSAQFSTVNTPPSQYTPIPTTSLKRPRSRLSPMRIAVLVLVILLLITGGFAAAFFGRNVLGTHADQSLTSTKQNQGHTSTAMPSVVHPTQTPLPATLTSCPATGTARAAVMPSLVRGSDQNIIYIADQGTLDNPISGAIERHDVTNGAATIEVLKMPQAYITEAHVSQNGQWILFTAKVAGQFQLRMVRVDGQSLQTLFCASSQETIFGTEWTFDQKVVVFDKGGQSGPPNTYLLDINSGNLQLELQPTSSLGYKPRLWLSSTKLYMVGIVPNSDAIQNIYLLDTQNGPNQHDGNLKQIASISRSCADFDSSYDNNLLFISQCTGGFDTQQGPSSINIQLSIGSVQNTIYSTSMLAVTTVRVVDPLTLLVMVENTTGDTSQNGLWRINTDGTELTRLTTDDQGIQGLCPFSQFSWSNLSIDGTMYALQLNNPKANLSSMAYGSLKGGPLTQFDTTTGTEMYLVGWTTL